MMMNDDVFRCFWPKFSLHTVIHGGLLGAGPEDRLHLHSPHDAPIPALRRGQVPLAGSDLPVLRPLPDTHLVVLRGTAQGDTELPEAEHGGAWRSWLVKGMKDTV